MRAGWVLVFISQLTAKRKAQVIKSQIKVWPTGHITHSFMCEEYRENETERTEKAEITMAETLAVGN